MNIFQGKETLYCLLMVKRNKTSQNESIKNTRDISNVEVIFMGSVVEMIDLRDLKIAKVYLHTIESSFFHLKIIFKPTFKNCFPQFPTKKIQVSIKTFPARKINHVFPLINLKFQAPFPPQLSKNLTFT